MLEDSINYAIALTTLVFRNCECVQSENWVKRAHILKAWITFFLVNKIDTARFLRDTKHIHSYIALL